MTNERKIPEKTSLSNQIFGDSNALKICKYTNHNTSGIEFFWKDVVGYHSDEANTITIVMEPTSRVVHMSGVGRLRSITMWPVSILMNLLPTECFCRGQVTKKHFAAVHHVCNILVDSHNENN